MSELLQSGQYPGASGHHPDADQLSAFIEQALPAHEREQVLAHLALCAGCRETVALSLPHLQAPPIPAPQPGRRPAPQPARTPWLRNWAIFTPAAAVLAASIFFALSVHHSRPRVVMQTGTVAASQPPAPVPPSIAEPAPRPNASAAKKSRTQNQLASAPQIVQPRTLNTLAENPPPPSAAPAPPVSAPLGSAQQSVALGAPAAPRSATSFASESTIAPPAQAAILRQPLPSGQPPLSVASSGSAMLAIDARHAVYLSRDSGQHWTPVAAPWQGRAVQVSLVPASLIPVSHIPASHIPASLAPSSVVPVHPGFAPAAGALQTTRMATFAAAPPPPAKAASLATPSLAGAITDPTGAAIPSAAVTLRDAASHTVRTLTTDAGGRFFAGHLAPGSYTLEAQAAGFRMQSIPGIVIQPSRQTNVDLTLQVGAASQTVQVAAAPPPPVANAAAAKSEVIAARASAPPPPDFEVTTDTGEHWTSPDGLAWQRR